jgi:EGF-like domain
MNCQMYCCGPTDITCADRPCSNGGTCSEVSSDVNGYRCDCAQGFDGINCDSKANDR